MKYISDSEILNWNRRLEKSDYSVFPVPNNKSAEPYIGFRQKVKGFSSLAPIPVVVTIDPFIRYDFTFSIASNRTETFFDLFKKLSLEPFGSKTIFTDLNNEKISDILFSHEIIENKEVNTHYILEKEYTRYTYHFGGKLSSIMAYVMYLEDSINFFSEIWGYSEDGSEVCLLKYPIGTIVSLPKDKSIDYLVLDYKYRKLDGKYYIDFIVSEMINNKGSVITYGEIYTFRESELSYSRNSRIDNILN
jgi:hypothetical protein